MRRAIPGLLIGAIALDVVYWTLWFTDRDLIASEHNQAYNEFENAFPLADAWLGIACLLALLALRAGRSSAFFWLGCAGSAGMYLFCMDLLYDVENGIFLKGAGGVFEAVIVLVTLVFSVSLLTWAWSSRRELEEAS